MPVQPTATEEELMARHDRASHAASTYVVLRKFVNDGVPSSREEASAFSRVASRLEGWEADARAEMASICGLLGFGPGEVPRGKKRS